MGRLKKRITSQLDIIYNSSDVTLKGMDIFQMCYDWCNNFESDELLKLILEVAASYCKAGLHV